MKNRLIVLTQSYPFGKGEPFLETEAEYWYAFDEVFVCPLAVSSDSRKILRKLPCGVELIDLRYYGLSKIGWLIELIRMFSTRNTWHELSIILQSAPYKKAALKRLISLTAHTDAQTIKLKNVLKQKPNDCMTVLYSYWLYEPAIVAVNLKETVTPVFSVSRVHGFDLYEERGIGYIPLREKTISKLDRIFCVSDSGREYLNEKNPQYSEKYRTRRLGTKDYGLQIYQHEEKLLRLVSCSNCIPVKRVHLIIEALSFLSRRTELHISWTHYGAGELLEALKENAKRTLGDAVEYSFSGSVKNADLMELYRKKAFDIFLNVSGSEGIPVSVMEAMSFGIPVIATDVGGTSELVIDGECGYLLRPNFSPEELAYRLIEITHMPKELYMHLRESARAHWMNHYSAENNYSEFVQELMDKGEIPCRDF